MKKFITEPAAAALAAETISAVIEWQNEDWKVVVVIARRPAATPVEAEEIDAVLLSSHNHRLEVTEKPQHQLPEAGGSLHTSVNAVFHFKGSISDAALLLVYRQGQSLQFTIRPV